MLRRQVKLAEGEGQASAASIDHSRLQPTVGAEHESQSKTASLVLGSSRCVWARVIVPVFDLPVKLHQATD